MSSLSDKSESLAPFSSDRQFIDSDMQMVVQRGEGGAEVHYDAPEQSENTVEICFNLGGSVSSVLHGKSGSVVQVLEHGQAHIAYYPECSGHAVFCPHRPVFCIGFLISLDFFEHFFDASIPLIREQMHEEDMLSYTLFSPITADMKLALYQLMRCPFLGKSKGMFLEGKTMELASHLRQIAKQPKVNMPGKLTAKDYKKMWQVKAILDDNLESPPSIVELAGLIGVNECKLKSGFKQVHGVSPYRYLADHRLEEARRLICEKKTNVSEAALSVGYSSLSHFSKIFRIKYGVTPQEYMVSTDCFYDI